MFRSIKPVKALAEARDLVTEVRGTQQRRGSSANLQP
jgi:hypothetical protein